MTHQQAQPQQSLESFTRDLLAGKVDDRVAMIDLVLGDDEYGETVYVYTRVGFSKYAAYKEACNSGEPFDPEDYGEIIATGKGNPPKSLIAELRDRYGFFDDFEDQMTVLGETALAHMNA